VHVGRADASFPVLSWEQIYEIHSDGVKSEDAGLRQATSPLTVADVVIWF